METIKNISDIITTTGSILFMIIVAINSAINSNKIKKIEQKLNEND